MEIEKIPQDRDLGASEHLEVYWKKRRIKRKNMR